MKVPLDDPPVLIRQSRGKQLLTPRFAHNEFADEIRNSQPNNNRRNLYYYHYSATCIINNST